MKEFAGLPGELTEGAGDFFDAAAGGAVWFSNLGFSQEVCVLFGLSLDPIEFHAYGPPLLVPASQTTAPINGPHSQLPAQNAE